MDASLIKRMKELGEENRRLKKMYAEERLVSEIRKKALEGSRRREMAVKAQARHDVSIRIACLAFAISETCYRYQPKLSGENAEIADWLLRLTQTYKRWGFGLCYIYLRNIKGYGWNQKRVYRIYPELDLNLRIKPWRRIKRDRPDELSVPITINTGVVDGFHERQSGRR